MTDEEQKRAVYLLKLVQIEVKQMGKPSFDTTRAIDQFLKGHEVKPEYQCD